MAGNNNVDHLVYFSVELTCETWRSYGIVMDSLAKEYSKTDPKGNIILSKDLVLRMKADTNVKGDYGVVW